MLRSLLTGVLTAAVPLGGHAQEVERFAYEHAAMGMTFRIVLYASGIANGDEASQAAFDRIDALDRSLNDYDPTSEISRLSASAGSGTWIVVSDDLWNIVIASQALAAETDGAFDITIGPLTSLWRWTNRRGQLPDVDRIADARARVGHRMVELDRSSRRVRLTKRGMRLDAGGIGKGFAADEAMAVLQEHGVTSALIDAGGDIVVSDAPPGTEGWRIAVPSVSGGVVHDEPKLIANKAVATSGDAFRFVDIDDVRYSHIVDPRTGLGLTERRIVTVTAPTGAVADALASAVSVLGANGGLALLDARPEVAGRLFEMHKSNWKTFETSDYRN